MLCCAFHVCLAALFTRRCIVARQTATTTTTNDYLYHFILFHYIFHAIIIIFQVEISHNVLLAFTDRPTVTHVLDILQWKSYFSHRKANQSGIVRAHFLNNSKWKTEMATAKAGSRSTRIGCCDSFPSATTVPLKLWWGRVRKASKSTITYYLIHYKFNERVEDERTHAAHSVNEIWNFQVVCTDFKSMPKTLLIPACEVLTMHTAIRNIVKTKLFRMEPDVACCLCIN